MVGHLICRGEIKLNNYNKYGGQSGKVRAIRMHQDKMYEIERERDYGEVLKPESEMTNKKSYIYTEVLNISKRYDRMAIASESYGKPQTPENVTELIEKYKLDIAEIQLLAESEVEKRIIAQISDSGFYDRKANIFDDISVLSDEIINLIKTIEP